MAGAFLRNGLKLFTLCHHSTQLYIFLSLILVVHGPVNNPSNTGVGSAGSSIVFDGDGDVGTTGIMMGEIVGSGITMVVTNGPDIVVVGTVGSGIVIDNLLVLALWWLGPLFLVLI